MSHNSTDYFEDLPLSGQALPQPQWKWMFRPSYLPAVSITILLVALSTRFLSSIFGASKPAQNGAKTIPFVPYWFPIIGHLPQMGLSADTFLDRARRTYKNGAFTLNLGGTTHSIIFHPALAGPFMNQKSSVADAEHVSKSLMFSNFGFPKDHSEKYDLALHDVLACYKNLLSEPSLGIMVGATVDALRDNIANLVGFVQSPVDMANWERTADVELKQLSNGEQVAEASLLPLIRDFVAATANPSLMGTDFVANNPTYFQDLWTMDRGFLLLATGLPRWAPIPTLTRAHIARRRMIQACSVFHEAMEKKYNGQDPGPEWSSLDNVSNLIKARMLVYRKHNWSIEARAACEVALLWAMNANANPLIFWMLNHIYSDAALLAMLREEIAPYVRVKQPGQDLPIPEAPRIEAIDQEGLVNNCPLLKSAYIETLRVDTAVWSFKIIRQDFVLQAREKEYKDVEKFLLKKGTYAHVAHDLHHKDARWFDEPEEWRADRHVKHEEIETDGEKKAIAEMGTVRPFGGGQSMCKGRAFAQKEALIYTAAVISMWDMEPAGGHGMWKMPRHKKATGTYTTRDDVRVWIRRRNTPNE